MSATAVFASGYEHATTACAVVDRSERGKLALSGAGAKEFLQGQVTNDVVALVPGSGCYAAFLTPKGKMLGDLRVLDAGEELLLDTERVALQELFNLIRRFSIGYEVELHKRTLQRGLLSLVGPASDVVLGEAAPPADPEHAHELVDVDGIQVRAIRTDAGIDLLCEASDTERLAEVLRARGAEAVEEAVLECLRIERGRPRYGVDLDDTVIPQEAGLNERAVSFTKGCYVGQETVARLFYRGKPNRRLMGLRLSAPVDTRAEIVGAGEPVAGRVVGRVGSVTASPRLGPLALALVRREVDDGATVLVGPDGVSATAVPLPFEAG